MQASCGRYAKGLKRRIILARHGSAILRGDEMMANFFKALKRGAKAAKDSLGPGQFEAGGRKVVCPHCKNDEFEQGSAQLNTAGLTFLGLDWLNKSASILVCTKCSLIQWFGLSPDKLD